MPVARPETSDSRVIAHVDMDCFYVQVEQRKQPDLRGLPTAVVQYNAWKGGALIAVSYEARKYGVKRSMRGAESKEVCPQIQLVQVPVARGKADLSTYRNAGSEVVSILSRKGRCERASIDEVYLDLTDAAETMLAEAPPEILEVIDEEVLKSHVLGLNSEDGSDAKESVRKWLCRNDADRRDKLLACGAFIIAELRLQVLKETEFTCSAGIAHNKILAKLASGMNKPAQQTVVPFSSVKGLLDSLPIKKITWLWNIARGISGDEVEGRLLPKSHGSGKTFPGPQALKTFASVQHWLHELCEELSERLQLDLDQNKRIAHTLVLHATAYKVSDSDSHKKKFPSKSCPLRYGTAKIQEDALSLFQAALREYLGSYTAKIQGSQNNHWGITSLSVSASKIVPIPSGTASITKYFHGHRPALRQSNHRITSLKKVLLCQLQPQIEFPGEETMIKYAETSSDHLEDKIDLLNDQNPCCSSKNQARDEFTQETVPVSTSGSEHCSGMNQSQLMKSYFGEEPCVKLSMPSLNRQEQKRKAVKDKGTCSILRFFKNQDPSCAPQKLELVENIEDVKAPPLSPGIQSRSNNCLDQYNLSCQKKDLKTLGILMRVVRFK
ncbi:DNA polymerase eta isoform X2 [Prunus yedoensis var. nudiflora]|uniref:DNA polymerase eta n=1 Tax=Prunus yedoensis var. nudiflora TaxID=2094558 RepID=A0A315AXF8_PRUYE|nr:DNA polymerase eta isoform X2 [Prunus yedoensis var. nudiflora]